MTTRVMMMMMWRWGSEAPSPASASSSGPGRRGELRLHGGSVAASSATATAAALVEGGRGLQRGCLVVGGGRDGRRGRVHVTHVVQLQGVGKWIITATIFCKKIVCQIKVKRRKLFLL